ncbi:hypothetical protein H5410_054928 [Solanum commersonii]|uniref:TTF-type domain-containing protein n=1 Tax=Solanum commersonii TaxID=4109 RepID=A0A9J5WGQ2_SOLCO|nr:hypothetical protein H5410_054928 [Solanum commersonii]
MDKYVTRSKIGHPSSSSTHSSTALTIASKIQSKIFISDVDLESLEADPGIRKPIAEYNSNIRDDIRRYYILKKPCQPKDHKFPKTKFGKKMRQFFPDWFNGRKWLEYSITKDAAFCLCCYLFKNECEIRGYVIDVAFTKTDYRAWNKATERFRAHSKKEKSESRRRLSASVDVARFLLKLGLSFRGHDESRSSLNRGIFLELLQWYGDINENVGSIILEKAPKNEMMCSPSIQKDIVDSCAKETIKSILEDLDGDYFGILVNESKDVSHKEQMTLVLRYVNKEGEVIERFVGIIHLTLVALAKKDSNVDDFFCLVTNVLNIVGASFKRMDLLWKHQAEQLEELLILGEVHTGRGLNQECGLQRPGDTRWGSHCRTLDNLIVLFPSVIHVLEFTGCECPNYTYRLIAKTLMDTIKKFDFAFMLHLMWKVLMMTN